MNKKVIILPLDCYPSGAALLSQLEMLLKEQDLANMLAYIKVNDGVHNPDFGGPEMVSEICKVLRDHNVEAKIFLDLKIYDVSATVKNVLTKYQLFKPGILTVSSSCSIDGIIELRKLLPNTKLAMVSMLTDIDENECQFRFGQSAGVKIYNDLMNIRRLYTQKMLSDETTKKHEPFDAIVCSPRELEFLKTNFITYQFIVPGIRDEWMKKENEHQKRVTGVAEALVKGASYVVMGAQITKGNPEMGITPEESRKRTVEQIEFAYSEEPIDLYKFTGQDNPLETLKKFGGYYESPKDANGKYLGPLVAYAGTYQHEGKTKNKVGFEYFNFARVECDFCLRSYFADLIIAEMKKEGEEIECDVLIGAPMGGIMLATEMGQMLRCDAIFGEKQIIAVASVENGTKEESRLVIDRHEIQEKAECVIVEDVCNNFSTTGKFKKIIEEKGGKLVAIVCAVNRSGAREWEGIPVLSSIFIPTAQYEQEAEEVRDLIADGKIVWKPKQEWQLLEDAMKLGQQN